MIGKILQAGWTFLSRLFWRLFDFLSSLLGYLLQQLFKFLQILLRPIFIVIALVLYFVYKVAALAIALIKMFLAVGKLLLAFIKGIFVTLSGFTYTGGAQNHGQWTSVFKNVVSGLEGYQLGNIAYVLQFLIWFGTAFAAIRILGSIRNGGG